MMPATEQNLIESYNGIIAIIDAQLTLCREIKEANNKYIKILEDRIKNIEHPSPSMDDSEIPF